MRRGVPIADTITIAVSSVLVVTAVLWIPLVIVTGIASMALEIRTLRREQLPLVALRAHPAPYALALDLAALCVISARGWS